MRRPRYRVRLEGDTAAAARLAPRLQTPDLRLRDENGTVFLESSAFESLPTHNAVFAEAQRLVEVVRGALRLAGIHEDKCLAPQAVFETGDNSSERNTQFIVVPAIVVRAEAFAPTIMINGQPAPTPSIGAELAVTSPAVAHALTLFAREPSFVELYKVMEVVADDVGGLRALDASRFIDRKERRRFSQTANSMRAAGDEARHATASIPPPSQPMSLYEATGLIRDLVTQWLAAKAR